MLTRPAVSVIVVSWNTCAQTQRCLAALPAALTGEVGHEVIVVDNASRDGSVNMLAARSDVRLIRNPGNRGYAAAVNQAYAGATGDLILLLNSDVVCRPGSIGTLVRFLAATCGAAGVAPLYLNPDGTIQQHYLGLPGLRAALALGTGLRMMPGFRKAWHAYLMHGESFEAPRPVPQPSTSCLLLRRDALPRSVIFDERLPLYFNDVLLAHDLAVRGRELWMTPDAVVVHTLGASTRLLGPAMRSRHHLGGLVRYLGLTQPRYRVAAFQAVALADRVARRLLGRRGGLGPRDSWAAVRGDVGPLPDGDVSPWVIMFSGVRWSAAVTGEHRQHALARELTARRRVLFVDPPGCGVRWRGEIRQCGPRLWHATPPNPLPLGRHLPPVNWINRRVAATLLRRWLDQATGPRVLWLDEDLAAGVAGRLGEERVVYDVADLDWTFTRRWNRWHLRRAGRKAVGAADLILVSSPALPAWLPPAKRAPLVLPNGCDPELFRPNGQQAAWVLQLPRPLLGYAGAVDTRACDGALLAEIARRRPDWNLVLMGPATPAGAAPLAGLPNVHLVGPVRFDEMPAALRACDVCLIPYRVGGLVDYVLPKKVFEYLALGKPAVATPLPALSRLGHVVRLAAGADGFIDAIHRELHATGDHAAAAARREVALTNTWSIRGMRLHAALGELDESGR